MSGLAIGVASGVVAAVVPVYGLPLIILVGIASLAFKPRAPGVAGILIGAGSVFLYGVFNTWAACRQIDDFCGEANIQPLLILAVALLALGSAAGVGSLVRSARQPRHDRPSRQSLG
jgi:hypothetical protein